LKEIAKFDINQASGWMALTSYIRSSYNYKFQLSFKWLDNKSTNGDAREFVSSIGGIVSIFEKMVLVGIIGVYRWTNHKNEWQREKTHTD